MNEFNSDIYLPHLSIDCVIFGFKDKQLKVLIAKMKFGKAAWSLPGGYIQKTEGIDKAATRILNERTGLKNIYLEQFRVFGHEKRITGHKFKEVMKKELPQYRQPVFNTAAIAWMTSRFVCIGYYALVDIDKVNPQSGTFDEYLQWSNIQEVPAMTYDHNEILTHALEALRKNLDEKLIGFKLLPETFTMKELQELYEAVYERPFASNNFQKKMLDLEVLERLEKKFTGAQNKAPYLYRFKH